MNHNWEYKKIEDFFDLQMGKTPSRENSVYWDGDNVWVSIADLKEKYIETSKENITDRAVNESRIFKVSKGTVIMSFKLTVGRVAIAKCDLFTNEAIMAFLPKQKDIAFPDYIYYYLKGHKWIGANKAVMGLTLNKKSISENFFAYPPLPIQQQIVAELDRVSEIIEKKKQQVKELDTLAQSIFYDMFGDPVTNDMGWEVELLSNNVEEMFLGPFGSALKVDSYVPKDDSFCMVYEQKHAIQARMDFKDTHYIDETKYRSLQRFSVKEGDFIMSCRGTIGKVYQLPKGAPIGIIHPSVMKIRTKNTYDAKFFKELLVKTVSNENTSGNCVQMAITAKELGRKALILPPLSLQQSFTEKIEAIEKQKELINASIKEAQTLFDARMDYWFGE